MRARVECCDARAAGAVRQLFDEAANAATGLAVASLVERRVARALAGEAVDVRRRSDDEQVDIVQRRDVVVDREELTSPSSCSASAIFSATCCVFPNHDS